MLDPTQNNREGHSSPTEARDVSIATDQPVPEIAQPRRSHRFELPESYRQPLTDVARHTTVMVLCLTSMWVIHLVLKLLLGSDARFFDFIPVRYVIDVADIAIIAKFVWEIVRDFSRK